MINFLFFSNNLFLVNNFTMISFLRVRDFDIKISEKSEKGVPLTLPKETLKGEV